MSAGDFEGPADPNLTPEKRALDSFAVSLGKTEKDLTYDERKRFHKEYDQANDRPINIQVPLAEGGLTPKQLSAATGLANSLKAHPFYRDMADVAGSYQSALAGAAQKNGYGDILLINSAQRVFDPGATVREGDVTMMQSARSLFSKIAPANVLKRLEQGDKLSDEDRGKLVKTLQDAYRQRAKYYDDTVGKQYRALAAGGGIPFEMVGSDFSASDTGAGSSGSSSGTYERGPDGKLRLKK